LGSWQALATASTALLLWKVSKVRTDTGRTQTGPAPAEWVTVRRIRVKDSVETLWWLYKSTQPKADSLRVA